MSEKGVDRMSAVDLAAMCGEVTASELRRIHPRYTEEMVVRDFERHGHPIAHRTVKGWIAGNVPSVKHLLALIQIYGTTFRDAISAPALTPAEERALDDRLATLEAELRNLRADLASTAHRSRQAEVAALHVARRSEHTEGAALAPEVPAARERG